VRPCEKTQMMVPTALLRIYVFTMLTALACYLHAAGASAAASAGCFNDCAHLHVVNGFLLPEDGQQHKKRIFVGTNWSAIQRIMGTHLAPVKGLPGLDANESTMRHLTLTGNYVADVPLELPSRIHFRLNGNVTGSLTKETQGNNSHACPYGFQYYGRCALVKIRGSFVSVTGGNYTSMGGTAFGISCEGCSNVLIQNLTASGASQGNIHFFGAGPAIEIRYVEAYNSNRGVWSQTPSQKVLITHCWFHHNGADGIDLDSMSKNVMVRHNRLENNHRCGVFVEEGASNNIIVDNIFFNNTFGVGFCARVPLRAASMCSPWH
jgi:parallel beta-helix repeat protein